jgi:hypothetical protein
MAAIRDAAFEGGWRMKIIGISKNHGEEYIAIVSHKEIEKFLNLYYRKRSELKVGEEIDLGKGYDFFTQTTEALGTTKKFIEQNKTVIDTIFTGISIMGNNGWKAEENKETND